MGERESSKGFFGLLAVGMGVCCGIPLLLSAGALGTLAGIGLRIWLIVAGGAVVAAVGLARWARNAASCNVPASPEVSDFEAGFDDRKV